MTGSRTRPGYYIVAGLLLSLLAVTLQGVQGEELEVPSEDQCRPYIEKALKDLGTEGSQEHTSAEGTDNEEAEDLGTDANDNDEQSGGREKRDASEEGEETDEDKEINNEVDQDQVETVEVVTDETLEETEVPEEEADTTAESQEGEKSKETVNETEVEPEGSLEKEGDVEAEGEDGSGEEKTEEKTEEALEGEAANDSTKEIEEKASTEAIESNEKKSGETVEEKSKEDQKSVEDQKSIEAIDDVTVVEEKSKEDQKSVEDQKSIEAIDDVTVESETGQPAESAEKSTEDAKTKEESKEEASGDSKQEESKEDDKKFVEEGVGKEKTSSIEAAPEESQEDKKSETEKSDQESTESGNGKSVEQGEKEVGDTEDSSPEEEELIMEIEIPEILRPRDHISQLLKLDEENEEKEKAVEKAAEIILRDLKRLYDNAIKPLETLYKYRDLSNRHFGDPEIFSKPLVLFMGPWSGGKSSIINYLLDIEYKPTSLRTGAEPSPAYFNIVMHGEEEEILDGTQLAADWTFSGLQKFGQGLLDRLKGYKLKNKLLEKVNIVEIPGILEIRKQVQRLFPFNDACQWFIDRADIIFLVYDPSKLDVGPETEAILDQLKGREYQTRIILNKADQVRPEELMRVQGALIWNISPLMSSAEPPIMYSASLWSIPFESGAPTRLLYAQERAFLRDLRSAVDKRVEHKIASARRFAVRVRNHAKMVDCYLTTYYNHKSFFAKKKETSDRIVENPQDYHIYEGLSTLTNISRYDLPDPDVYRDFFRLNPLYDFPLLSSTCTYFRGCPINRLDIAIAYDLPELVGKYKKSVEAVIHEETTTQTQPATVPPVSQTPQKEVPKNTARSGASRISLS